MNVCQIFRCLSTTWSLPGLPADVCLPDVPGVVWGWLVSLIRVKSLDWCLSAVGTMNTVTPECMQPCSDQHWPHSRQSSCTSCSGNKLDQWLSRGAHTHSLLSVDEGWPSIDLYREREGGCCNRGNELQLRLRRCDEQTAGEWRACWLLTTSSSHPSRTDGPTNRTGRTRRPQND